jgi:hypothetical protein
MHCTFPSGFESDTQRSAARAALSLPLNRIQKYTVCVQTRSPAVSATPTVEHPLEKVIARQSSHLHTEDSVFENHTSGGKGVAKAAARAGCYACPSGTNQPT